MNSNTDQKEDDSQFLKDTLTKIIKDPNSINDLDSEKLTKITKGINPHVIVPVEPSFINISLTNWRESYLRKFNITSTIAYLYRALDHFEHENKEKNKEYNAAVKYFLDRHFKFNPDRHVKTAATGKLDSETVKNDLKKTDDTYRGDREKLKSGYQFLMQKLNETGEIISKCAKLFNENGFDDISGILLKKFNELDTISIDVKNAVGNNKREIAHAYDILPPVEVFHNYDRYIKNHYKELREVVEQLYCDKPDIEFSINYYDTFKTEEEAKFFCKKYEKELKYDIITLSNQGIYLLGPFKENQDKVDFYNKNMDILKQMEEQRTSDARIGKELMNKKIVRDKTENIKHNGVDDKEISNILPMLNNMGMKRTVTLDEQIEIEKRMRLKEVQKEANTDVADDDGSGLQVDVYYDGVDEKGERTFNKTHFFSEEAALSKKDGEKHASISNALN